MKFSVIAMVIALGGLLAGCSTDLTTEPTGYAAMDQDPLVVSEIFPPSIEEVVFDSHGERLNGLIYLANGEGPHPTIVLLHGYPGNEKNLDLAQTLRRDGFNVLFFYYRGAWGSEGEFAFEYVIEDVASALAMLRENADLYRVDTDHIILIGHSMGGFAALHGAAHDEGVACVAGIAPGDMARIPDAGKEAASGFVFWSDTLQMLSGWTGEKAIAELTVKHDEFVLSSLSDRLAGKSVLLIAADKDASVPPEMVDALAMVYRANPEIDLTSVTLSGDHSFSWSRFALAQTVLDWIQPCKE